MYRDLLSLEVGVTECSVLLDPHIVEASVPSIMVSLPAVATGRYASSRVIPFAAQVVDIPRLQHIGRRRLGRGNESVQYVVRELSTRSD